MNSEIILVKDIKLDKDYINVLSYNESKMLELCRENAIASRDDYSFIRVNNNSIYVNFTYNQCLQANYIAFQNKDYSNKWFFAFIDDIEYRNDGNTEIFYTVDAWSTWFDKWTKKPCFINRQHVNDDTIGLHTVSENLDIGDVIEEKQVEEISFSEYSWVGILSSYNPATLDVFSGITVYNKQVFGKKLYLIECTDPQNLVNLGLFIMKVNGDRGGVGDIDDIFIIPDALINRADLVPYNSSIGTTNFSFYGLNNKFDIESFDIEIDKQYNFYDYTPKNNKCFVYPYNYLYVTNNNGNDNIYKYENFNTQKCVFKNEIALSIGGSGQTIPLNYKRIARNEDESLPLGKYPTCQWSSDSFTSWLTSQAVNIPMSITNSAIGSAQSYASGDLIGTGVSIANAVGGLIGQFYSASLLPNVSHGGNTADIVYASNRNTFVYRSMRVKTENLKIIDDYFSRFGYAIKRVLLPNITGRRNWNYVEIGSSEEIGYGSVPSKYMQQINNACRKGVTIWHNHSNLGNFSLDNSII